MLESHAAIALVMLFLGSDHKGNKTFGYKDKNMKVQVCKSVFNQKAKFLVLLKFFACSAVLIVGGIRAHFCFKDAFCFHSFLSIKNKNYFHKRKSIIVSLSSFFHSLYNYLVLSNQQQGLKF